MASIENIFILLTPFQQKVVDELFLETLNSKNTLLLYKSDFIQVEKYKCNVFDIGEISVSKNDYRILSINDLLDLRKKIEHIKSEVVGITERFKLINGLNFYIGNDKDVYSQFMLNLLTKQNKLKSVIAFEEGVGFYKRQNFIITFVLNILYVIFSKIILGEKINYVFTLGVDKRINIVYARLPALLPFKRDGVKIVGFKFSHLHKKKTLKTISNFVPLKLLIFTIPSQDGFLNDDAKMDCVIKIFRTFQNYEFYIKLHPREDPSYLIKLRKNFNFSVIDNHKMAEDINYFEYNTIINFYSSVVIDLLESGYPRDKIVTIGNRKYTNISFFNETNYITRDDLNNDLIKKLK